MSHLKLTKRNFAVYNNNNNNKSKMSCARLAPCTAHRFLRLWLHAPQLKPHDRRHPLSRTGRTHDGWQYLTYSQRRAAGTLWEFLTMPWTITRDHHRGYHTGRKFATSFIWLSGMVLVCCSLMCVALQLCHVKNGSAIEATVYEIKWLGCDKTRTNQLCLCQLCLSPETIRPTDMEVYSRTCP